MELNHFAKILVVMGMVLIGIGGLFYLLGHTGGHSWLGRLPGDIYIQRKNFVFYFPLVTSLIISILLSIVINIIFRR